MSQTELRSNPAYDFSGDCMEFRLTYAGRLLSNGKAPHKHEIRRHFHPQLQKLWKISPHLCSLREPLMTSVLTVNRPPDRSRLETLPERFSCGPFRLVPLVTRDLKLACSLDVLYLRPDYPSSVLKTGGDIDNRLKTLFDALRIPGPDTQELGGCKPQEGENPLYCLLEDDVLITHVSVKTDNLLEPVLKQADDARLIITVKILPIEATLANIGFLS
jgi:hypothetical protein